MEHLKIKPHHTILVLNSSYIPINFTSWKRAIVLILKEKVQVISERVVRLVNYIKIPIAQKHKEERPPKTQIYKRDKNTCQYCGSKSKLTLDHVIPKSKGGLDTWDNLVVACSSCNVKKGDKLLEHTNMKLKTKPRAPWNKIAFELMNCSVSEWKEFSY